ncbi:ArsR family transcriptional regulator [Halorubrum halophilum]|uniref:ArsR family transcriptional regulator n=1 Tax=Halorubrum halophilum TaxID=413816 RepID=UPI0012AB3B3D|nr:ArsR family transcriptional regulator [Halorubrum halophilum]
MSDAGRFDQVLESLADPYRRQLLLALIEHNPQDDDDPDPLNIHPEGDDALSKLNIYMGHLPKLDKMGIIEWDEDEDEIIKGPDWEEFEPLLRLIAEHKDELPKEWFEETDTD